MSFAAPHVGFVVSAYGLSAVVIAGLVFAICSRARALERRLAALQAQGAQRRRPAGGEGGSGR